MKTGVVILSAGKSQRMGRHKAFLRWNKQYTFIEKIVETYIEAGLTNIVIVANKDNRSLLVDLFNRWQNTIKVIVNEKEDSARMDSIKLGLSVLESFSWIFIQDVDRPFVSSALLIDMQRLITKGTYVAPVFNGESGHPILISQLIINHIINQPINDLTLRDILKGYNKVCCNWNHAEVLINLNSADQLRLYFNNNW